jgi:hypothetical protein
MRFRRLFAIGLLAAVVAGCSSDPRDIKLSEMNQPEHATRLLEALSPEERELLARYVAANARTLDYKLTVGEALQVAAEERDTSERERVEAAAATGAFLEEQERLAKAERETRLAQLLDQKVADLAPPARRQAVAELQHLMMSGELDPNSRPPLPELTLLGQYVEAGVAPADQTLGEAFDQIKQDPAAMQVRLQEARAAAQEKQRNDRYLDGLFVKLYVERPDVRATVHGILPPDDVRMLDEYVAAAQREPGSNVLGMRVSEALAAARQQKETSL